MSALRALPTLVWAATGLHVLLLLLGSLTMPLFEVRDERFHADMVVAAIEGNGWPGPGERRVSPAVEAGVRIVRTSPKTPERVVRRRPSRVPMDAEGPCTGRPRPSCAYQPTLDELAGYPIAPRPINRATQHPPLYYVTTATVSSAIASIAPLPGELSIALQFWLWRLVTLLMVAPLPVLAALTARELDVGTIGASVASLLPLGVPALYFRTGPMINNDALLILLVGAVTWLSVRTARRGPTRKRTAWMAVLTGLALLTKGLALLLPIGPLGAYWVRARRSDEHAVSLRREATAYGLVTVAVGGWWWVRNLLVHGELQPIVWQPSTPEPQPWSAVGGWLLRWVAQTFRSFWGGWFVGRTGTIVALLALLSAGSIVLGFVGKRRIAERVVALAPLSMLAAVAATSFSLFMDTGSFKAAHGRYAYPALVGLAAVVAAGLTWGFERLPSKWRHASPIIVIAGAFALHIISYLELVEAVWGTPEGELAAKLQAMLAWSPVGPALPIATLVVAGVGFVAIQVVAVWTATNAAVGAGTPSQVSSAD